jgi:hypothetical protein
MCIKIQIEMNHRIHASAVLLLSIFAISCSKEEITQPTPEKATFQEEKLETEAVTGTYTTYLIRKGSNFCDPRTTKSVTVSGEMRFAARFDQSAVYTTIDPVNQYDINKLWGFSEGFNNQYNSARIGWAYNDGALRLYGYVYAKGVRYSKEITPVSIGSEIPCSIKLNGSSYILTANGVSVTLPRGTTTTKASGLQQYPYFGGDEKAPQDIRIQVKPL